MFLEELKDCTNYIYKNEYLEQRAVNNIYKQKKHLQNKTMISMPTSLKKLNTLITKTLGLNKGMKINHNIFGTGQFIS